MLNANHVYSPNSILYNNPWPRDKGYPVYSARLQSDLTPNYDDVSTLLSLCRP